MTELYVVTFTVGPTDYIDDLVTTLACHKSQYSRSPWKTVIGKMKLGRIIDYVVTRRFDILNDLGVTCKWPSCNFKCLKRLSLSQFIAFLENFGKKSQNFKRRCSPTFCVECFEKNQLPFHPNMKNVLLQLWSRFTVAILAKISSGHIIWNNMGSTNSSGWISTWFWKKITIINLHFKRSYAYFSDLLLKPIVGGHVGCGNPKRGSIL